MKRPAKFQAMTAIKRPASYQAMKRPAGRTAAKARYYARVKRRKQDKATKNAQVRARRTTKAASAYEPGDAELKSVAKVAYDAERQAQAAQQLAQETSDKVVTVEATAKRALRVALHNRARLDVIDEESERRRLGPRNVSNQTGHLTKPAK